MPVKDGLKDIIDQIGTAFTFGVGQSQSGKFIAEPTDQPYWIKAKFHSETVVIASGDLVTTTTTTGTRYLVVSFIPEMFEDTLVQYRAVLLTCNMEFSLQRKTEITNDDYDEEIKWPEILTGFGARLDNAGQRLAETRIGDLKLESDLVYVPAIYEIDINDRLVSVSGEKYKVESKKDDQFPGVFILGTVEDTR